MKLLFVLASATILWGCGAVPQAEKMESFQMIVKENGTEFYRGGVHNLNPGPDLSRGDTVMVTGQYAFMYEVLLGSGEVGFVMKKDLVTLSEAVAWPAAERRKQETGPEESNPDGKVGSVGIFFRGGVCSTTGDLSMKDKAISTSSNTSFLVGASLVIPETAHFTWALNFDNSTLSFEPAQGFKQDINLLRAYAELKFYLSK
jgi:hypothetical protein